MTDNKAALDALDRLVASIIPYDRHPDIVKQDIDIIRQALTTPPAQTVTGDKVQEAIDYLETVWELDARVKGGFHAGKHIKTLIRAVINARSHKPDIADWNNQRRIQSLMELGFTHRMENGDHVVEGNGITFRHTSLFCLMSRIVTALQSHAMPREVVEKLEEAKRWSQHPAHVVACIDKALALLGGKEGE